ncbi:N-acetyltransferase family protein [Peribacillus simplex]|uniref:GNAT family N-acetyltransferase n=1 Tax=Peribacillus simplex TaxID=1478 RepID=UPI003D2C420B
MDIRKVTRQDAGKLAALINHVEDSGFMLYNPGERKATENELERQIEQIESNPRSVFLVAASCDDLIGYFILAGNNLSGTKHSAKIVIGISEQERGKGVGTKLFQKMEEQALEYEIRRLELTVIANNEPALSLYKKIGFELEGTKRDSLLS